MRKLIYFVLIIPLILAACSHNSSDDFGSFNTLEEMDGLLSFQSVCSSVTDAFLFPENWTGEDLDIFDALPDEIFLSMSTCGLLETLLEHPTNRNTGPWCSYCNSLNLPGVTMFNDRLKAEKAAVELFKREDCFAVLKSKYLTIIKEEREIDFQIRYFEMLLASDMCMLALAENEKTQLMAMALQKGGFGKDFLSSTPYIMIAIMRSCDYAPFISEVSAKLVECTFGYCNLNDYDILKYAKQFLTDLSPLIVFKI